MKKRVPITEKLAKEGLSFTATNSVWAIPIPSCDWDTFIAICQDCELDYEIEDRTIISTLVRMEREDYFHYVKKRYEKKRERLVREARDLLRRDWPGKKRKVDTI